MSDTPIHDSLGLDPLRTHRKQLHIDDATVTVALPEDAVRAIQDWHHRTTHDLAAVLSPFGIHPHDIAMPTYERVVYEDEFAPPRVLIGWDGASDDTVIAAVPSAMKYVQAMTLDGQPPRVEPTEREAIW